MTQKIKKILEEITTKKNELDRFRPLPPEIVENLRNWFNVELAYSSNAIEGNTLTSSETALVIEKGLTIGGKTVKEHLEAINHSEAFEYILDLANASRKDIARQNILDIHWLILRRINDENAGCFRKILVRIAGLDMKLPDPFKLPDLMNDFISWLHSTDQHPVMIAAQAHLKLVAIHPFIDGNGRTARLLMNLLLLQEGYPPAIIDPKNRSQYIDSLSTAQLEKDEEPFNLFILEAVARSLDRYLEHAHSVG